MNAAAPIRLLLVDIDEARLPNDLWCALRQLSAADESCPSVYQAMAHVSGPTPTVVIVGVDHLTSSEFDFFPLARRRCPDTPILVWGLGSAPERLQRAMRAGATAILTEDSLDKAVAAITKEATKQIRTAVALPGRKNGPRQNELARSENVLDVDRRAVPLSETAPSQPSAGGGAEIGRERSGGVREQNECSPKPEGMVSLPGTPTFQCSSGVSRTPDIVVEPEADATTDAAPKSAPHKTARGDGIGAAAANSAGRQVADDEDPRTARVPWLRYHDAPLRVGPNRQRPVTRRPAGVEDEPLLTPEELEALLGNETLRDEG